MSSSSIVDLVRAGDHGSEEYWRAIESAGPRATGEVVALFDTPDPDVRRAAVSTLPLLVGDTVPSDEMIDAVIALTRDREARVRDHATFVLAQQWTHVDTSALREALVARLEDDDHDTRCEALIGLARRHDERALPVVRAALTRPDGSVCSLEVEAAGALGDHELHPLLALHLDGWDEEPVSCAEVAFRLTDPAGPGDDVVEGVAELYRRRVDPHGDVEDLTAWNTMDAMLDLAPHRAPEFLVAVLQRLDGDPSAQRHVRSSSALAQLAAEHDQR